MYCRGPPDPHLLTCISLQAVFSPSGDKIAIVGADNANNNIGIAQINIRALKAGMILLTIVPILAVYPLILRYFTKGTMVGAVKG